MEDKTMAEINKERLEKRIDEWKEKVLKATDGMANTYVMMKDIDTIIAEEFDHEKCLNDW